MISKKHIDKALDDCDWQTRPFVYKAFFTLLVGCRDQYKALSTEWCDVDYLLNHLLARMRSDSSENGGLNHG